MSENGKVTWEKLLGIREVKSWRQWAQEVVTWANSVHEFMDIEAEAHRHTAEQNKLMGTKILADLELSKQLKINIKLDEERLQDIEALLVALAATYPPPADVDAAVKRIRARLEGRLGI